MEGDNWGYNLQMDLKLQKVIALFIRRIEKIYAVIEIQRKKERRHKKEE